MHITAFSDNLFLGRGKKKSYGSGLRAHYLCHAHGTFFCFPIPLFPFSNRKESHRVWWKIRYVIVIIFFSLYAKKWRLFALEFTRSKNLQWRSGILCHIFHIPCRSMVNLCLSTDKKFFSKTIFTAHPHTFWKSKGPEPYLFFTSPKRYKRIYFNIRN